MHTYLYHTRTHTNMNIYMCINVHKCIYIHRLWTLETSGVGCRRSGQSSTLVPTLSIDKVVPMLQRWHTRRCLPLRGTISTLVYATPKPKQSMHGRETVDTPTFVGVHAAICHAHRKQGNMKSALQERSHKSLVPSFWSRVYNLEGPIWSGA